jgi:hypothetical protein
VTALALPQARFEVAVIKPAPNGRPFTGLLYANGSQMRAGGTLQAMIATALQIPPNVVGDMVTGLPSPPGSKYGHYRQEDNNSRTADGCQSISACVIN